jgi:hypothetical protein
MRCPSLTSSSMGSSVVHLSNMVLPPWNNQLLRDGSPSAQILIIWLEKVLQGFPHQQKGNLFYNWATIQFPKTDSSEWISLLPSYTLT